MEVRNSLKRLITFLQGEIINVGDFSQQVEAGPISATEDRRFKLAHRSGIDQPFAGDVLVEVDDVIIVADEGRVGPYIIISENSLSMSEKPAPPVIPFDLVITVIKGELAVGISSEGVPKFDPLIKPSPPTISQAIQVESGVHVLCNGPIKGREYLWAEFAGVAEFWEQKARLSFALGGKDPRGDIEDGNPPDIKNRTPHYGIPLQGDIHPFCGEFPIGRGNIARGEGCIVYPVGFLAELFSPLSRDIEVAFPAEQCPIDDGSPLCLQIQFQAIAF